MFSFLRILPAIVLPVVIHQPVNLCNAQELRDVVIAGWKRLAKENETLSFTGWSLNEEQSRKFNSYAWQGELQRFENAPKAYLKSKTATHYLRRNSQGIWQFDNSPDDKLQDYSSMRYRAFSIANTNLLEAIDNPNFEFSEWRRNEDKIEFVVKDLKELELRKKDEPHRPAPFGMVRVEVDARNHCRIIGVSENGEWKNLSAVIQQDYSYDEDPFFPSKVSFRSDVSNGKTLIRIQFAESISHKPQPESQLSLAIYGLEEP
ncbi:MAG: hypothetical protein U0930_19265 [Pirellulales bacterium]